MDINIQEMRMYERLKNHNVKARKYFYPLVTEYECYKDIFMDVEVPVAKYISDRIITYQCILN